MKIKFILPSLIEAESPFWRPIKYSLFPPIGLATLAAYTGDCDQVEIVDQHVETLNLDDEPDLVAIEVYITNAYRAYAIADHYRAKGVHVILGGLHVTALPEEALLHADTIFCGPAEESFPRFLQDFRKRQCQSRYSSRERSLGSLPPVRRDLIKRELYFVPNSLVVSRGCPHRCGFCYKEPFFAGGKSHYTQPLEAALAEIERLPGKHLYFLDDHLLGNPGFARSLFAGMKGMGRLFQGAATVDSVLNGDLIELAAGAGLRSLFIGFESLNAGSLQQANKIQNRHKDYVEAIHRLHDLGIMINGSFVFGLDGDTQDVFETTVNWAVKMGITTATFHIATPYPGTEFHRQMREQNRLLTSNWNLYDTRHVTFAPVNMSMQTLQNGYDRAYRQFYRWGSIVSAASSHNSMKHKLKHLFYASGWKKFEPIWNVIIQAKKLGMMTPLLEAILSKVTRPKDGWNESIESGSNLASDTPSLPIGVTDVTLP